MNNASTAVADCFHCGEPIPKGVELTSLVFDQPQPMCCIGCQAVADTIVQSGMTDYYRYRTAYSATPPDELSQPNTTANSLDNEQIKAQWVSQEQGQCEAALALDGMSCAACAWLIEKQLNQLPGVERVQVNASQQRMRVRWQDDRVDLSDIVKSVSRLGYRAYLFKPAEQEARLKKSRTKLLMQLGLAGVGAMQVMMLAIGLYIGGYSGDIGDEYRQLLRGASLLFATAVVLYSAQPFFVGAWRDLRARRLGMDVPVSIAIGGAYLASLVHTVTGSGEVYFDSVSMFTFFLLIGRYLEMSARHRAAMVTGSQLPVMPELVRRLRDGVWRDVSVDQLGEGDLIQINHGAMVPVDALLQDDMAETNEALLTGEFMPVARERGERIVAGAVNLGGTIELTVVSTGDQTTLNKIQRLVDMASAHKPALVLLADRIARYFVLGVLLVAAGVYGFWSFVRPEAAFHITLSVLVVTCPCALSLAMPAVVTAAYAAASKMGLVARHGEVLESLANVTDVVFDKTGTLTNGQIHLEQIHLLVLDEQRCLAVAAAIERHSDHPIAHAFKAFERDDVLATGVEHVAGGGVTASVDHEEYRLGTWAFVAVDTSLPDWVRPGEQWIFLVKANQLQAGFMLQDALRVDALRTVDRLKADGYVLHLLSGDSSSAPIALAEHLGIDRVKSACLPEDKLQYIDRLQQDGRVVLMLGDGVNDAPVLAKADVGMVVSNAADLSKLNADLISMSSQLSRLNMALALGIKARKVIKQNLVWAVAYNLLALPMAAAGFIPPWVAAIGMSGSSLLVVLNSLRLMSVRGESHQVSA